MYDVLRGWTITVGSLPHTSPSSAVQLILDSLEGAPHPPQLPFREFTRGFPDSGSTWRLLSSSFDTQLVIPFVLEVLAVAEGGSAEDFDIGPQYGQGIRLLFGTRSAPGQQAKIDKKFR